MDISEFTYFTVGTTFNLLFRCKVGAVSSVLTLKTANHAKITLSATLTEGKWLFTASATQTANYAMGDYTYQITETFSDGSVEISYMGKARFMPNLATALDAYDPRSQDEIILEAINAVMTGTASQTQKRVTVGDKTLEYTPFKELAEKREYYENRVAYQNGSGTSGTILINFK